MTIDEGFIKRFMGAVRKGLTDEMIAEEMDLPLEDVRAYRRRLFPDLADEPESRDDSQRG